MALQINKELTKKWPLMDGWSSYEVIMICLLQKTLELPKMYQIFEKENLRNSCIDGKTC